MRTRAWKPRWRRDPLRLFPRQVALGIALVSLIAGTLAFAATPSFSPLTGPIATPPATATIATDAPKPKPVNQPQALKRADAWAGYAEQDLAFFRSLPIGGKMGHITVPKMGADIDVVKGAGDAQLVENAGFVMGSYYPGPNGNVAIGAHRTLYKHPFRYLDRLNPGDEIVFRSPYREYRYVVTGRTIVKPTDVQVLRFSKVPIISLIACHPPGSEAFRMIVRGKLISVTPLKKG